VNLEDHPTVRRLSNRARAAENGKVLDGSWLRRLARDCGADDVGLVEISRRGLDPQRVQVEA
jgi:hypothetical protein